MTSGKPIPFKYKLSRPIIKWGFYLTYRLLTRVKVYGRKNIPKKGPYIVTFNHVSIFDPPLLVAFWSKPPEIFGAEYLWESVGFGSIMRSYGVTPVSRASFDRKLLAASLDYLKNGRILTIAPEGSRSHKPGLQHAKPGAAFLAAKSGAPIVPVGIVGTTPDLLDKIKSFSRPGIQIYIGKPYKLPDLVQNNGNRKAIRQELADYVMIQIAKLLPEEYQGVYANRV